MLGLSSSLRPQLNNNVGVFNKRKLYIIPQENESMAGKGIIDNVKSLFQKASDSNVGATLMNLIPSSDANARDGFPGEQHAILKLSNGKYGVGNYIGPHTQLIKRLKRGDPPRTEVDKVAMGHDIRYGLAKDIKDIRRADNIMLAKVKDISNRKSDSRFNIAQANLIKAKTIGEDLGVIKRDAFSGDLSKNSNIPNEDLSLMKSKLNKLSMGGYGNKSAPAYKLKMKMLRKSKNSPAVVSLKGSGEFKPVFTQGLSLKSHPANIIGSTLADLGIHGVKKAALPIAGLVLAAKTAKAGAKRLLPWIKRKFFGGKGMVGMGKKNEALLLKHLEDGIKKMRAHNKKGLSGKGLRVHVGGTGFFSSFVKVFKKIAKPLAKVATPFLSTVAPELGIPLTISSNFL